MRFKSPGIYCSTLLFYLKVLRMLNSSCKCKIMSSNEWDFLWSQVKNLALTRINFLFFIWFSPLVNSNTPLSPRCTPFLIRDDTKSGISKNRSKAIWLKKEAIGDGYNVIFTAEISYITTKHNREKTYPGQRSTCVYILSKTKMK